MLWAAWEEHPSTHCFANLPRQRWCWITFDTASEGPGAAANHRIAGRKMACSKVRLHRAAGFRVRRASRALCSTLPGCRADASTRAWRNRVAYGTRLAFWPACLTVSTSLDTAAVPHDADSPTVALLDLRHCPPTACCRPPLPLQFSGSQDVETGVPLYPGADNLTMHCAGALCARQRRLEQRSSAWLSCVNCPYMRHLLPCPCRSTALLPASWC